MIESLSRPLAVRVAKLPDPHTWQAGLPEAQAVAAGAIDALDKGRTHYTDRPGIGPLRERVAQQLNEQYQLGLSADEITITCGSEEAEYVALAFFLSKLAGAILTTPGDCAARVQPLADLLAVELIAWDGRAPDNAAVIYIGEPGPHSEALLQFAQDRGLPVIWSTTLNAADVGIGQQAELRSNSVLVGGLDTQLPGWRIGWLAGHKTHGGLRSYKQSMTICTPSISQWAALAMLEAQS